MNSITIIDRKPLISGCSNTAGGTAAAMTADRTMPRTSQ